MYVHKHLDYGLVPRFHCDAPFLQHTTFGWYVSFAQLPRCCSCFDRLNVLWYVSMSTLWSCQASISTRQVSLHSGLLPSVFGCTGHVCKFAVLPDVAVSISSNITFAACFDHRCIFASQVKSLPFQHRNSHFVPDCCHRCSDAWGTSASSPLVRTLPLRSAATSLLRRVSIVGASQVNALPFQHRKSHFVPDCCHRCSDARGTSASLPLFRMMPLRFASI